MARLNKEQIAQADDLKPVEIEVPEWGGSVLLRGLSGKERDAFEASVVKRDGEENSINLDNLRARLVAKCLVDENGQRLYSDDELEVLGKKSGLVLARLFAEAQKLSGLTKEDVKEIEKSLKGDQSGASTSV